MEPSQLGEQAGNAAGRPAEIGRVLSRQICDHPMVTLREIGQTGGKREVEPKPRKSP